MRKVWYIGQASESDARFNLLISQTGLRSENQIAALRDHLVKGMTMEDCCTIHDIRNKSNLERDLEKINQVAEFVERIKEIDWEKFKK